MDNLFYFNWKFSPFFSRQVIFFVILKLISPHCLMLQSADTQYRV